MKYKSYLDRLEKELKGFAPSEKEALIEEIANHIEMGLDDEQLSQDSIKGMQKLEAEMGSPSDLGHGFQEVYRPNRWVDFLLVFIPSNILRYFLYLILVLVLGENLTILNNPLSSTPYMMISIRVSLLLSILLSLVSLHRRSIQVLFFWLPQAILTTFTLVLRENRWLTQFPPSENLTSIVESIFWIALLAVMIVWFLHLLWINRHNILLTVFAIIPFLTTIGNLFVSQYIFTGYFPGGYQLPSWHISSFGGFPLGLYQISLILWVVLFYISQQRLVRWLGLLLYTTPLSLMNFIASTQYPFLAVIWTLPVVIVLVGCIIDLIKFKQVRYYFPKFS